MRWRRGQRCPVCKQFFDEQGYCGCCDCDCTQGRHWCLFCPQHGQYRIEDAAVALAIYLVEGDSRAE